jgi:outer membrane protein assembly factor BamE (lipoprotein component of BamABCDE complex)
MATTSNRLLTQMMIENKQIMIKQFLLMITLFSVFACSSPKDEINAANIVKVKVGMKIHEVKNIMGNPDEVIINTFKEQEFDFIYSSPSKYGDDFHVFCSRNDSTVLRVALGDY